VTDTQANQCVVVVEQRRIVYIVDVTERDVVFRAPHYGTATSITRQLSAEHGEPTVVAPTAAG
jgi:hypothetical protein